ncbi:MAG: hypothetical protein EXQ81_01665 [Thermoleophilia bacterium]|nr:hypothetical protein [Thermoleophilia bacterium]
MARYAPAALVAALLLATALAFAYTEKLKLTPSPILGTRVVKVFSPVCECETDAATISFRLRKSDRITVDMIDGDGNSVRTLVDERPTPAGRVTISWDGRDDSAGLVPEGSYKPRVHMARQRRTIVLPNSIRVDVTPPRIELVSLFPRVFSPDGNRRADKVVARYRVDEEAGALLYVDAEQRVRKRGQRTSGRIEWFGRVDGEPMPPGVYQISLAARDVAGNLGPPTPEKAVVIRYVALGRERIEAVAGTRFAVLVLTDAAKVEWRLGKRTGVARPGTLRLRAPLQPGRFTLTVTANGFSDRAAVFVRRPKP